MKLFFPEPHKFYHPWAFIFHIGSIKATKKTKTKQRTKEEEEDEEETKETEEEVAYQEGVLAKMPTLASSSSKMQMTLRLLVSGDYHFTIPGLLVLKHSKS